MSNNHILVQIESLATNYIQMVKKELHRRWEKWPLDLSKHEMHEVIGALLARQVTLSTQLAQAPMIWNGHIAPIILRSMVDNYINLAWIFNDPLDRSRKFILHGLGQEKLHIEHHKTRLYTDGKDTENDPLIERMEEWLNSQRYTFLTEVNVGSWSGIDTRSMAEEAGCVDLYNYAYAPFSAATHNMWHHIAKYNLEFCPNPLHRYHRVPIVPYVETDIDYLYRAAKYVKKAFTLFDQKTGLVCDASSAFDVLAQGIRQFNELIRNQVSETQGSVQENEEDVKREEE